MKVLLASLNAKFIHSSLSLHSLKSYSKKMGRDVKIIEFTINNNIDSIIGKIFQENPKILGFSCYIWNINETLYICETIKKILPDVTIILGGPEVSYNAAEFLENDFIDIIVMGEGEKAFDNILKNIEKNIPIDKIAGICLKIDGKIIKNNNVEKIDLIEIPFVYGDLSEFENKILYFETSRGCPYSCQYCLSSVENGVRFLELSRVFADLSFFLKNNVAQVKFVDRTFNAKKDHALKIWEFLIENDNGFTNFHFEIAGDIIDDNMLEVLKNARKGLFQFEIGVQSTNEDTLKEIQRYIKKDLLFKNILKIKNLNNIHIHLDLIAGLPFEDIKSFKKSFDDVYNLYPQKLQLGFLKLLRGSGLRENADKYKIVYKSQAPFEVLSTDVLSYSDVLHLKGIEEMLEKFYNSGQFSLTIKYFETMYKSKFELYDALKNYFESKGYFDISHKRMFFYEFLFDFGKKFHGEFQIIIKDLIRFDMFSLENIKNIPKELNHSILADIKGKWNDIYKDENIFKKHLDKNIDKKQIVRNTHIDYFSFDIILFLKTSKIVKKETKVLFDYYMLLEDGIDLSPLKCICKKVESRQKYE